MVLGGDQGSGRRGGNPPEEYEHIDFTQWYSGKEPLVTAERAAKGDLSYTRNCEKCQGRGTRKADMGTGAVSCADCKGRGRVHERPDVPLEQVRFAQVQVRSIVNHLWQNGELNDQHHHDAQTYELWQTIFRARSGYRNNPVYELELLGMRQAVSADGLNVDDFVSLIRRLQHERCRIIEMAIYTQMTEHFEWMLKRGVAGYRSVFDTLSWIMKQLREEHQTKIDAANNTCNLHPFM